MSVLDYKANYQESEREAGSTLGGVDTEQRHHLGGKNLLEFGPQLLLAVGQIHNRPSSPQPLLQRVAASVKI